MARDGLPSYIQERLIQEAQHGPGSPTTLDEVSQQSADAADRAIQAAHGVGWAVPWDASRRHLVIEEGEEEGGEVR